MICSTCRLYTRGFQVASPPVTHIFLVGCPLCQVAQPLQQSHLVRRARGQRANSVYRGRDFAWAPPFISICLISASKSRGKRRFHCSKSPCSKLSNCTATLCATSVSSGEHAAPSCTARRCLCEKLTNSSTTTKSWGTFSSITCEKLLTSRPNLIMSESPCRKSSNFFQNSFYVLSKLWRIGTTKFQGQRKSLHGVTRTSFISVFTWKNSSIDFYFEKYFARITLQEVVQFLPNHLCLVEKVVANRENEVSRPEEVPAWSYAYFFYLLLVAFGQV